MGKDIGSWCIKKISEYRRKNLFREEVLTEWRDSRFIKIDGKRYLNFASNDYLGLATVRIPSRILSTKWGAGSAASRLLGGNIKPIRELEKQFAKFKKYEDALYFSSAYTAAIGLISSLHERGTIYLLDELVHASIIDAVRITQTPLRYYRHCDPDSLQSALRSTRGRKIVITDSLFSMDGDLAPVDAIAEICEKFGATLIVDDTHATGIYGKHGEGARALYRNLDPEKVVLISNLSKAIGWIGGFVCCSRNIRRFLYTRARTHFFTTAPPALLCEVGKYMISKARTANARRRRLWKNVTMFCNMLASAGYSFVPQSPIIPFFTGSRPDLSDRLKKSGIFAPLIRFPTVPKGKERIRISITASHTHEDLAKLAKVISRI